MENSLCKEDMIHCNSPIEEALGSRRAWKGDLGMGEEVVTWKLYLVLAFTVPTLQRVIIGCCKVCGGGGGGGRVFDGGVFGSSAVFSGDGVGNGVGGIVCGVACGVAKYAISTMIVSFEKDRWWYEEASLCGERCKGNKGHPNGAKVGVRGRVVKIISVMMSFVDENEGRILR
ncbi:hypothetical protein Tco_0853158 [Tanacetum coccineum]